MKAKKGVTLTMLAIILVLMSIILTVIVINGSDSYNSANKLKLQTEISQIEILVENYIKRNSGINFASVELDTFSYTAEQLKQFEGENIVDNKIQLYVVELDKIDAKEVAYGAGKNGSTDRYLYSATTKKVYYEQGIKIDEVTYHRIGN